MKLFIFNFPIFLHKLFFLNLINIIYGIDKNFYCSNNIQVKLIKDNWLGDLEIFTNVINDGVELNLQFSEDDIIPEIYHRNIESKGKVKINENSIKLATGEILDLSLYVDYYNSDELPILTEIRLNGKNICENTTNGQVENITLPNFSSNKFPLMETSIHYPLTNAFRQPSECGIVIPETKPLIFNSEKTYSGEFPWHSALFYYSEKQFSYICGGSLITNDVILTAAHCTTTYGSSSSISPENLIIYLGKYKLHRFTESEQNFKIKTIINHPDFDPNRFYADISLLKLNRQVIITNFVRPICLWNFNSDYKLLTNRIGTIPGFGYNEKGTLTEQLAQVKMPIVSFEECIWSKPEFYSRIVSDKTFCGGFRNGSSVCNGDSGGGMVFEENSRYYIRGIVSVGAALRDDRTKCDPMSYVVFTDVSKFTQWINANSI